MNRFIKYRFLFFILFVTLSGVEGYLHAQNTSGEQNLTIDSLKLALKNATNDTTKCNILFILTETTPDGEWEKFNEQLKIFAEKNLSSGEINKFFYLKHLSSTLNNIGYLNEKEGDIAKALEYHYKSLKIREAINDKLGIANSLNNISAIYNNQGDYPKTLEYLIRSLKILEEINDIQGLANTLSNIGFIYDRQNDNQKAINFYERSLKYMKKINDNAGIGFVYSNIGNIYCENKDYKNGLEYYKNSLLKHQESNNNEGITQTLNNISIVYIKLGKVDEAFPYAELSLKKAFEVAYPVNIQNSAKTLKQIFEKQNKYKEAFEMYELELKMRDSINNQETQKAAIKKQMQYTYEKKELETKAEQDKKDAIAKAELKQKENERNYFIAGFGLVIVLALFILRGYKQKQKANAIILEQKHMVDEKQKEILDSIHYAKRIQTALLPNEKYIDKSLTQLNKNA